MGFVRFLILLSIRVVFSPIFLSIYVFALYQPNILRPDAKFLGLDLLAHNGTAIYFPTYWGFGLILGSIFFAFHYGWFLFTGSAIRIDRLVQGSPLSADRTLYFAAVAIVLPVLMFRLSALDPWTFGFSQVANYLLLPIGCLLEFVFYTKWLSRLNKG